MKKIFFILFLVQVLYPQENLNISALAKSNASLFPLNLGNKWYYQVGSTRDENYGIIKEVTDTLSNGFREITCKNFYRAYTTITKEYWGYIDGKFYNNTSPSIKEERIFYNSNIVRDSCIGAFQGTGGWRTCLQPIEYKVFDITGNAQKYIYEAGDHTCNCGSTSIAIVLSQIGIVRTWYFYDYYNQGGSWKDSTILIGMYKDGEFLGDSIFANPYRTSSPVSPWNGSGGLFLTVTLQWKKAVGVISYRLQVSKDTSFSNPVIDEHRLTDTMKIIGPLEPITIYYWRVGTLSDNGKEYWSSAFLFETYNPLGPSRTMFTLNQNFPNPFHSTTKIKYSIKTIGQDSSYYYGWPVQIKVYDILGKEVLTLVDGEKSAGSYEVNFDGSNLSAGIYFYKLQCVSLVEVKKIIILK
jgi:hypothetical protein